MPTPNKQDALRLFTPTRTYKDIHPLGHHTEMCTHLHVENLYNYLTAIVYNRTVLWLIPT